MIDFTEIPGTAARAPEYVSRDGRVRVTRCISGNLLVELGTSNSHGSLVAMLSGLDELRGLIDAVQEADRAGTFDELED